MPQDFAPTHVLLRAFPGLPEDEAQQLIDDGQMQIYPPATVLCQEDALESTFYIIMDGKVRVTKRISSQEERLLKTLNAGDFFGEMAIIHEAPRAATVTTVERTRVLEITKEDFKKLLGRSASVARALVKEVSRRLRENDAMAIEDLRLKAGELAAAYQQLAEQEYARREFLTTIAHELRTPLTAASGFLQMIQMGMLQGQSLDSEVQQAAVNSASRNIQQIISLVNDILFVQELDLILPRFQEIDINKVLLAAVDQYRAKAEENQVVFHIETSQDIPPVLGDPESLERAFCAILDNAIKFSPGGGNVYIQAGHADGGAWVSFQDEGLGIPPEALPRIFERFFHVDRVDEHLFRGVGLGLAIARQVIQQHGGEIEVQSEPGKGAIFTIYLKAKDE